jgi:ribonucleoside-triphosphate reductase (thioredoxin)
MQLTKAFLSKYEGIEPEWGYGGLGKVIYQRTYSRPTPDGSSEEWWQTVRRVVEGTYEIQQAHCTKNGLPWNAHKAQVSAQRMYDLIFNFKFLPPGRGLWAMGTDFVRTRGAAALNNCAFISTKDIRTDFSYPFTFLMDMSMLGVGVGGDTRGAGSVTLQKIERTEYTYEIPDTREGWIESVRLILDAAVGRNRVPVFDYSHIRPAGVPVAGFGGISSGPQPLKDLHESLLALFDKVSGTTITSESIVDIFNLIGKAVASGGIRRSAEIMLGSVDDEEFISLKDPDKYPNELMSHRWASNNSLITPIGTDYERFVKQIMSNGEPGFFWIENAQNYRRMKDAKGDYDSFVMGQNPCGEISLESGEFCNLVEVYPASHDSVADFLNTLKFAYLYVKSVSLLPTHNLNTNAIVGRNRRVGVSVSGVLQAVRKLGARPFFNMLDEGYEYLRKLDREYSKWMCVPESIKLTTVKPSGTVSLLTGATPGVHAPHSEYYLRNVRFDPNSPLLEPLRQAGYPVEKSKQADNTYVVSFPVQEKFYLKGKSDLTLWEQLELAAQMQHWWADNSVSVTVTVKPHEYADVANALSLYETRLKSVSLLPAQDHKYEQAPYVEITKEQYDSLSSRILPIDSINNAHDIEETGCTTDVCQIL